MTFDIFIRGHFFVQFDEKFKKQPKIAQNRDFSKNQLSKSQ